MSSNSSTAPGRWRLLGALLLAALALLGGCHSRQAKNLKKATAQSLYANAHKAMNNNDFEYAIKQYEALTSRFPFTDQARQARLDLIYVYYRKGEKETATDAADQFLRENPTHPRIDYAWYMKGMIYFERTPYCDRALVRRRHGAAASGLGAQVHRRLQHRGHAVSEERLRARCAARA